jgi:hypothetical protein
VEPPAGTPASNPTPEPSVKTQESIAGRGGGGEPGGKTPSVKKTKKTLGKHEEVRAIPTSSTGEATEQKARRRAQACKDIIKRNPGAAQLRGFEDSISALENEIEKTGSVSPRWPSLLAPALS